MRAILLKATGLFLVAFTSVNTIKANNFESPASKAHDVEIKGDVMSVKIISTAGEIVYSGTINKTQAENLDFDLSSYPEGTYTVEIYDAEKLINRTSMINESKEMRMVIKDKKGKKVFYDVQKSTTEEKMDFDLSKFPKGQYTIEIYRGVNKLNSIELEN